MSKFLTKEEAIRRHRELWNKIAEMQEKTAKPVNKDDALAELGYWPVEPMNDCWCCEYTKQIVYYGCDCCPIEWPDLTPFLSVRDHHTKCMNSYYRYWIKAVENEEFQTAAQYAKAIAELPEAEFEDGTDDDLNSIFP